MKILVYKHYVIGDDKAIVRLELALDYHKWLSLNELVEKAIGNVYFSICGVKQLKDDYENFEYEPYVKSKDYNEYEIELTEMSNLLLLKMIPEFGSFYAGSWLPKKELIITLCIKYYLDNELYKD